VLFPRYLQRLKEAFFQDRRKQIVGIAQDLVVLIAEEATGLDTQRKTQAQDTLQKMKERYGYCDHCARDAAAALLKERFSEQKN
jgi:hypothetical protein